MKKLLPYIEKYRLECVLGPVFKLLEALFELFIPLIVADIIDRGIRSGDSGIIRGRAGLMILLGLIGMAASITAQYFSARAAVGFAKTLRHELFSHIQALPYHQSSKIGSSTLITRMTADINQVQTAVNMALRLLLRSPFIVLGAAIMAFTVDRKAAIIFAAVIPLLCVVVFGILFKSMPLNKNVQSALDQLMKRTRQNLSGVRVIRAFNQEETEIEAFQAENDRLTGFQLTVGRISALMNPLTYAIVNLGIAALIYFGGLRVDKGTLTTGSVVALVNYMSQISTELIKMANLFITISKGLASADRISGILELPITEEMIPGDGSRNGEMVAFEDVSFTYPGAGEPALEHISFSLPKGSTLGIIGGTGSGKSTIANLIERFYDVQEGVVRVNGQDVRAQESASLRRAIGLVPQKAVLFKGTIRENLQWGNPDATDEECLRALNIAQASDFICGREAGLDTPVEQKGQNFSGGQRQRLTIARALARNPELLILDDSSSALDTMTDAALRAALSELNLTLIIISQRTASIKNADRILVLDDGEQVGFGTHESLLRDCAVYREIYDSQFTSEGNNGE